jgi:NAD(P)-dependent dehydrogenase (short-subunit alcohol dehydrogenase family)
VTISDSLAGRRALVTGGSKGTGAAIARRLADGGATVMTTARTMPGGYPDPGLFVAADISTPGGAQQVTGRAGERFGVVDILVHTVGGSHASSGGFADFVRRSARYWCGQSRQAGPSTPLGRQTPMEPVQW